MLLKRYIFTLQDLEDLEGENFNIITDEIKRIYENTTDEKSESVVVVCGSFNAIKSCYIVIDNYKLKAKTLLDAVDFYFKLLNIFKKGSSNLNDHLNHFIRYYVYEEDFNPCKSVYNFCKMLN